MYCREAPGVKNSEGKKKTPFLFLFFTLGVSVFFFFFSYHSGHLQGREMRGGGTLAVTRRKSRAAGKRSCRTCGPFLMHINNKHGDKTQQQAILGPFCGRSMLLPPMLLEEQDGSRNF
jgi:hypothetical protein